MVGGTIQTACMRSTGKCDCCSLAEISGMLVSHSSADICGVNFTAGQPIVGRGAPGKVKRCGSLIVSVIGGQSYYGRVVKFFRSACIRCAGLFAYVEWLGKPEYPFEGTPLIVRVRDNSQPCPSSKVISIFDIDPTKIILWRSDTESSFYMIRLKGTDTIL